MTGAQRLLAATESTAPLGEPSSRVVRMLGTLDFPGKSRSQRATRLVKIGPKPAQAAGPGHSIQDPWLLRGSCTSLLSFNLRAREEGHLMRDKQRLAAIGSAEVAAPAPNVPVARAIAGR